MARSREVLAETPEDGGDAAGGSCHLREAEMEGGLESRSRPRCCPELGTCTFSYLSRIQTDLDSSTELILSSYYECFHCVFKY